MTVLEKLLENFGEGSRKDIIEKFKKLALADKVKSKEDFFSYWASHIGPVCYRDSILPISRQVEALKQLMDESLSKYIDNKSRLLKEISNLDRGSLEQPAWDSINFSDSKEGKRLQFGFKNRGCQYWHCAKNKLGCYNCGYFMGTQLHHFLKMTQSDYHISIIKQLEWIEKKYKNQKGFDVVDIEGDGSFFNPWEFPKKTQIECFRRLSKWENLTHILVESRPEYIEKEWISKLLKELRADQIMEIAVGVESMDNFVRAHCINKGTSDISDIIEKDSIKNIFKEIADFNGRVRLQVYLLVKPAFLTESEALADAVNSGRILYKWAKEFSPQKPPDILAIKYEPVVINRGTILEVLYQSPKDGDPLYIPLDYWTVAELLLQLAYDDTYKVVRFGAREDMDDYIVIPVVPGKNGSVSPIDFQLYDAIQRFCAKRSIYDFLADIESLLSAYSFSEWKTKIGLHSTAIEFFISTYRKEISESKENKSKGLSEYYEIIQNISRFTQNDKDSISFFKALVPKVDSEPSEARRAVGKYIRKISTKYNLPKKWKVEIDDLRCVYDSPYKNFIFKVDINDNEEEIDFDLWLSVPTELYSNESKNEGTQEIERKYLVDNIPEKLLVDRTPTNIIQGYIAISDNEEVRVRKKLNSKSQKAKYVLTRKSKGELSREEAEEAITPEFFDKFIMSCSGRLIEKDRYKIPVGPEEKNWVIELDIFKRSLTGLVSAEVEFKSEEDEREFQDFKPKWFNYDVTFDRRFKNNSLATQGLATVLTPYNRSFNNITLFLSNKRHNTIPTKITEQIEKVGLETKIVSDLVFETSGEINCKVVDVLRSTPLIIADDRQFSLNLLTKLAIREASERPIIKLSKTGINQIAANWNILKKTDTIPTVLSTNLGDYSLSKIVRSQQIVDNEILTGYEEKAKEIWVISTTLENDVGELFNVVYENLSCGKRYRYFIPALNSSYKYSEILRKNHGEYWELFSQFKDNIQFTEIVSEEVFNFREIVVYDPMTNREPFGFIYLLNDEDEDELIKMNVDIIKQIISNIAKPGGDAHESI